MLIEFYNFAKRENSTKQVSPSDATKLTISSAYLKDKTSFQNPTIILKEKPNGVVFSPSAYNYCSIPYWQRYYFVTDWRWANGVWEVDLKVDVLASFKTSIGSLSAYVVRAASASNGNVYDGKYPINANTTIQTTALAQSIDINHGCYIVGVVNCANTQYRIGAVEYYAMTESELNALLQFLYSGSIYQMSNITEIGEGLFKSLMNPMQYITSCIWIPLDAQYTTSHTQANIDIGYWSNISGVTGRIIEGAVFFKQNYYQLPSHPQAATRGNYLNYSPYTKHTLYYPPFGAIPINTSFKNAGSYLCIDLCFDVTKGLSNLRLSMQNTSTTEDKTTRKVFAERSGQCCVPIQLNQVGTDLISGVTGVASTILSGINGDYIGAANGLIGTAANVIQNNANSLGYNGSFMGAVECPMIVSEFYPIADEDNTEYGRPLCATRTLNTLSGYIQCGDADHELGGTDSERKAINNYLKNGFFYE